MSPAPRTALLAGATGLVGGHCLDLLLARPDVARVHLLLRRALGRGDAKIVEHVVDFEHLAEAAAAFAVDDVYACLGTTIKVAGTQERFRHIDHDYTVDLARRARAAGAARLALVSSVGAAATARTFYLRVKGETERDVAALGFPTLAILRPSMLVGERREKRAGEAVGVAVSRALAFAMVGGLRAYRPIAARTVAAAMVGALMGDGTGQRLLEHDAIVEASGVR
jgi:uncharacterized protein YbjT (DUF2867 family)